MKIPIDKETKHIKDHNVDPKGHSIHESTKIKTEYTTLMWGTIK